MSIDQPCHRGLKFRLLGWSAWTETRTTPDAWIAWANADAAGTVADLGHAPSTELSMMLRRRATSVGRAAMGAAMGLSEVGEARYILSTRHGELNRTMSLLNSLADAEPVSPADFSMSVHHGLTGLLSIATKNICGHSAVSAGPESFCYGLMEGAACLAEKPDEPVIHIHYDEAPDPAFSSLFDKPEKSDPVVTALCLGHVSPEYGQGISMTSSTRGDEPSSECLVLDFLKFLLDGAATLEAHGNRLTWKWARWDHD